MRSPPDSALPRMNMMDGKVQGSAMEGFYEAAW